MNALEVLKQLRAVDASLHRDGDALVLDSPRGAVSAELAEAIKNNRNDLLELLDMADDSVGSSARIEPLTRPEEIPLGLTQQRFWYLAAVAPESSIYNLPAAFRLTGELDVAALERAINRIIARHEILRTRITEHGYDVVQAIEPEIDFQLERVDLRTLGAAAMDELLRQIDTACNEPIPMDQAPMLKAALFCLAPADHVLFWMPHHVIWDGWSFDIFLKELQIVYSALEAGHDPELPALPLQYADYALWQRRLAEEDRLSQQMEYWSSQLSGELPVLELTTDRPRPDVMSFKGARAVLDIDSDTIEQLNRIGREEGATLFMVMLAGFYALLYRYSGQLDLIVGSPVQSRIYDDTDNIIGVFVNTLVLRTQLSPAQNFRQLVAQVKAMCISAYDHQDTPFEVLADTFESERTMSRNALYQVLFSYQDVTNRDDRLGRLKLDQIHIETSVAPTDLTVWLMETGNGLVGGVDYATELFDHGTVEQMIAHYKQLLSSAASSPLSAVAELSMIADNELADLARLAAGPAMEIPPLSVDQMVEEKALLSPDAIAVKDVNTSLSYRQLLDKAVQIASHLRHHKIGEQDLVGVCLKRSADLLPVLLGIFKSGAAYVPLDPDFPANRLEHMISDSALSVIITDGGAIASLPQHPHLTCLMCDSLLDETQAADENASRAGLSTSRLAYVIYTSGSTGQPKGVEVSQHAAVNLLLSMREQLSVGDTDRLLAITTLSFDISVLELFLPLISGASVVVADQEATRDGRALKQLIAYSRPTIMQATPATWRMLKETDWEDCEPMTVLCGGEEMPGDLAEWLCSVNSRVFNVYGPTETTVWSSIYRVSGDEHPIPIGRPIQNTRMYVLDGQLNPLPAGVRGDLYIAGDGLAAGYRNLGAMTAERFIEDPVQNDGSRMYFTGDQARCRRDGVFEFFGRNDDQVKIRGFRIELGEIETCLLQHPALSQAVVTAREDAPGDVRLVAYVVLASGQDVTVTEMRKFLRSSLPDYMVPQHMLELDRLPMTPNGKIDRKALPAPFGGAMTDADSYVAPRTGTEQEVAKIWQEVLNIERVGIYDNFFDLGGHSLLSMQVITLIRERLNMKLAPSAMLLNNLEQIAQHCDASRQNQPDATQGRVTTRLLDKIRSKVGM